MRCLAILPFLCLLVAFVLSMLMLFAGSKPGFLENYDLLTLNTSMIGKGNLDSIVNQLDLPDNVKGAINGLNLSSELQGSIVHSVAQALNIHDFYSMHVLDYCEGYYEPTAVANATSQPSKNVTFCEQPGAMFTFNITEILQRELRGGVTLADLHWPDDIQNALDVLDVATRVMFVMYCVGIGLVGAAMLSALLGIFASGVLHAWLNALLDLVAAIAFGIGSGIATAIAVSVTNAVGQYGSAIGVSAYRGNGFLTISWVATALVVLAMFAWIFDCCAGRNRRDKRAYKPLEPQPGLPYAGMHRGRDHEMTAYQH